MEKLIQLLKQIKPDVDFEKENNLIDDEILTSLDIVSLVASIDSEFDVEIPINEIIPENFNNIKSIYTLIEKLQDE
jgi:D-alanine--poly(phosphoribitol) ligase subunit 2